MNDLILDINLNNIEFNINALKKDKDVIAMVKANSYGVGIEIVDFLKKININYYGVSTLYEAIKLRKLHEDIEILIFTPVEKEDLNLVIENKLTLVISTIESLELVDKDIKIHLKFDTSMGRLGFFKNQIRDIETVIKENNLNVEGILTHFSTASNEEITNEQIKLFKEIIDEFDLKFKMIHLQNSLGSANYDIDYANFIRPGIAMYGIFGTKEEVNLSKIKLKNSLTLRARVLMIKDYDGKVSYDQSEYVNQKIATLRIGYTDGLLRAYQGYEFSNGNKIVGRICMCQTIITLKDDTIKYQEIFSDKESIYKLTEYNNTITYELLVSLSKRINRVLHYN